MTRLPRYLQRRAHALTLRFLPTDAARRRLKVLYAAAHVALIGVGLTGFVGDASPNVSRYGWAAAHAWSLIFVVAGAAALGCRIRGYLLAEAMATQTYAIAFVVWSAAVMFGAPRGYQSGGAFLAIALFIQAWVVSARLWVKRERQSSEAVILAAGRIHQLADALEHAGIPVPVWGDPPPAGEEEVR